MRKLVPVLLILLLALWGCGKAPAKPTTVPTTAPPATEATTEATEPSTEVTTEATTQATTEATSEPVTETTAPPTTEAPTVPVPELPTAATTKEELETGLKRPANYYNVASYYTFDKPENIDLYHFFYNGFQDESEELTDAEYAYLAQQFPEDAFMFGIKRLPVEKMDQMLREFTGLSLDQTNKIGLDRLVYFEETDCYYCYRSDFLHNPIQTMELTELGAGTWQARLDNGLFTTLMTLREAEGRFLLVSNEETE